MNEICTVKTIKESGSSLTIYITRELRMINLKKGDNVEVILKKVRN